MGTLRTLVTGACCAWPLPTDASCARVARQFYREAAAEAGIRAGLIDNGVLMASELAANTLHAGRDISGRDRFRPAAARPELWLYLRGSGMMRELVCKVFDACPGWRLGRIPGTLPHRAAAEAVSGRGLEVVHELSRGRWGHHLTRARLGGRKVRGKAVWFALPVPSRGVTAPAPGPGDTWAADLGAMRQCRRLSAGQAATRTGGDAVRPGARRPAPARRSARRGHLGALGAARPDRLLPGRGRIAADPGRRQPALDVRGPGRGH